MKRLIFFMIALLGFSVACEKTDDVPPAPEYDGPYVAYKFNLRVVDTEGNPIKGIEVTFSEDPDFKTEWKEILKTKTNAKGELVVTTATRALPIVYPLSLRLLDVDGEDNGGEFKCETPHITKQMAEGKLIEEGSGMYQGCYEVNIGDITLEIWDPTEYPPIID